MSKRKGAQAPSQDLPLEINEIDLFLAFPDGVYHYVCAECTAICCKGHGLSARKEELPVLLTRYPAIESLAYGRTGSVMTLSTLVNTCVLLDTDNMCRIEKDLGKAAKPALCNLFPFNTYKRIGRTIALYPHFLCPLQLQIPPKPGEVEGTHAVVDPAFRASGLFEPAYVNANVTSQHVHHSLDTDQVVAREREFLRRVTSALGRLTFRDLLRRSSTDSKGLGMFLERARNVLGLPRPKRSSQRDAIDDIMIAVSSPLRLQLLTLSSEGILRALALSELIIRRIATLPVEPLKPHAVFKFLEEHLSGIRLLARGEENLPIPSEVNLTPPAIGDPALTFASFVFLRELQSSGNVLHSFEKSIPKNLSVADRNTLVQIMARFLEHTRISLASDQSEKPLNRKRVRHKH